MVILIPLSVWFLITMLDDWWWEVFSLCTISPSQTFAWFSWQMVIMHFVYFFSPLALRKLQKQRSCQEFNHKNKIWFQFAALDSCLFILVGPHFLVSLELLKLIPLSKELGSTALVLQFLHHRLMLWSLWCPPNVKTPQQKSGLTNFCSFVAMVVLISNWDLKQLTRGFKMVYHMGFCNNILCTQVT